MAILTIGMPVYNEEKFISETIKSILNQKFNDFELIIIDNNSTDNTYQIIKDFQAQDSRIKIYKNDINLGSDRNFNDTFKLSSSKFFMWAGSHDLIEENYLSEIFKLINSFKNPPDLTFTSIRHIDSNGDILLNLKKVGHEFYKKNFINYLMLPWKVKGSGDMVYGVFKRETLEKTGIFSKVFFPDVLMMYEFYLYGVVKRVNLPLRKRRVFRNEQFNNVKWSEKYRIKTNRFREKGLKREFNSWDSYLPTLVMFFQIIYSIGFKKNINPFKAIYSFYFALVYLYKHKAEFLIDLKIFLNLYLFKKFFNFK